MSTIRIRGAREHNLRSLDLDLPHHRLIAFTGPSGSGKTSLAIDTLYAEGQRRYVESLSIKARRFLDKIPRPNVDSIEGLSPAICVRQESPNPGRRSTIGTQTEALDLLRLLYARAGVAHCPQCHRPLEALSVEEIVERIVQRCEGSKVILVAEPGIDGTVEAVSSRLQREGFARVRIDGRIIPIEDAIVEQREVASALQDGRRLEVVVDRLSVRNQARARLRESVELALRVGQGAVGIVKHVDGPDVANASDAPAPWVLQDSLRCLEHPDTPIAPLTPALFSFNMSPGACERCSGLGVVDRFDRDKVIADSRLSLEQGAVAAWGEVDGALYQERLAQLRGTRWAVLDQPFQDLPERVQRWIVDGRVSGPRADRFDGILPALERRARETASQRTSSRHAIEALSDLLADLEHDLARFLAEGVCDRCGGGRYSAAARSVGVGGHPIDAITHVSIFEARAIVESLELSSSALDPIVHELAQRLRVLEDVGLGYLSLDRSVSALSAGEAQRVRFATRLAAGLQGVLYVLDEPSAGLHPSEIQALLETLRRLRDVGNTVVVVEHDAEVLKACDHIVELGPGAGKSGGCLIAEGDPATLMASEISPTGAFLSGRRTLQRKKRAAADDVLSRAGMLRLRGASANNLRGIDVDFPLRAMSCVSGVSGAGKTSLLLHELLPAMRAALGGGPHRGASVSGHESVARVVEVDDSPVGRSPRSTPATYCKLMQPLRELFASLPEARARGFGPARFGFNAKGGRCEACKGEGVHRVEMDFLPSAYVPCSVCEGSRYGRDMLDVRYRGYSVADVLAMSITEAASVFAPIPALADPLDALCAVGLGYLELGRRVQTLSGGEAQRLRLGKELVHRVGRPPTLFLLDEPTRGLHAIDIELLLDLLHRLVEQGDTVIVVEHRAEVLRLADYLVDLGPGAGEAGGEVLYAGPPEQLGGDCRSKTACFL